MGGWARGDGERSTAAEARGGSPPGGPGTAARALLRPRLRPGDHAVHDADVTQPDLGGARPGHAGARPALVVVDGLRLADQRRRPGGGWRADRAVRRDGVLPDR